MLIYLFVLYLLFQPPSTLPVNVLCKWFCKFSKYWSENLTKLKTSVWLKRVLILLIFFLGMSDISKKISLTRAISAMRRLFPDEYAFYPPSWFIPAQLDTFIKYCNKCDKPESSNSALLQNSNWFIVKPDDGR